MLLKRGIKEDLKQTGKGTGQDVSTANRVTGSAGMNTCL